jgi:hypothetical protein
VGTQGRSQGTLGLVMSTVLGACLAVAACDGVGATPTPAPATPTVAVTATATATSAPTPTPVVTPAPTPTPAPTAAGPVMPTITTHHISTHGPSNFWTAEFDEPVVSGVATAAMMNSAIDVKVQAWITDISKADYNGSTLVGKYTVALLSPTLISLRFAVEEDRTGPHPSELVDGISFTVSSGATVVFANLFTNAAAALPVLNAQTQTPLTALTGGGIYMFWSPAASLANVSNAWTMTTSGLELSWHQGIVADEATGPVTITIPWSALAAVVSASGPAAELLP